MTSTKGAILLISANVSLYTYSTSTFLPNINERLYDFMWFGLLESSERQALRRKA